MLEKNRKLFQKKIAAEEEKLREGAFAKMEADRVVAIAKEEKEEDFIESITEQMIESTLIVDKRDIPDEDDDEDGYLLKFQLRFRQKVLKQPGNFELFSLTKKDPSNSKKRIPLVRAELEEKLVTLLDSDNKMITVANHPYENRWFTHLHGDSLMIGNVIEVWMPPPKGQVIFLVTYPADGKKFVALHSKYFERHLKDKTINWLELEDDENDGSRADGDGGPDADEDAAQMDSQDVSDDGEPPTKPKKQKLA